MHTPLRSGSPPDAPRPKARSADGYFDRRRSPSADGLLPPRPALTWLVVAAAIVSTTLAAFSLLTPCGGLQTSVLALLQSRFSFGGGESAGDSRAAAGLAGSGLPCQYGELPGRWHVRRGDNFSSWHTLSDACPLADRVTEYGVALNGQNAPQPSAYQLNLLVFGDSIDRYLLYDTCDLGGGQRDSCWAERSLNAGNQTRECAKRQLVTCVLPAITLGRQQIIGVSPEGPYFQDKRGGPAERVLKARLSMRFQETGQKDMLLPLLEGWQTWRDETGRDPDMVVFASALWDIARLVDYLPDQLGDDDEMPAALVQAYMRNTSDALAAVEALARPGTLLVYHTTAKIMRREQGDRGMHERAHLGRHGHLVALNAGGRQAATDRGWTIVDAERMSAGFAEPTMYLRDMQHPNVPFLNSLLNVYLNLWHDHARRCSIADSGRCPALFEVSSANQIGDTRR